MISEPIYQFYFKSVMSKVFVDWRIAVLNRIIRYNLYHLNIFKNLLFKSDSSANLRRIKLICSCSDKLSVCEMFLLSESGKLSRAQTSQSQYPNSTIIKLITKFYFFTELTTLSGSFVTALD